MATGQYRVTLDIPSHLSEHAAWLMQQATRTGVLFQVLIVEEEQEEDANFEYMDE